MKESNVSQVSRNAFDYVQQINSNSRLAYYICQHENLRECRHCDGRKCTYVKPFLLLYIKVQLVNRSLPLASSRTRQFFCAYDSVIERENEALFGE